MNFNIMSLIKCNFIETEKYYLIPAHPAVGILFVTKANPTFISGQLRMRSNGGGRYPSKYLDMINEVFGSCENTIEVCSNSVSNSKEKHCFTVDINEKYQPSLVDDCQTLAKIPSNSFDRYRADPPYNERTAREMYGTALPDVSKLLKAAHRVVKDRSLIVLLLGNVNRQSVPSGLKRIGWIPISCIPSNEMRAIHLYYKLECDTCNVSMDPKNVQVTSYPDSQVLGGV
jgi:hypothetical protein